MMLVPPALATVPELTVTVVVPALASVPPRNRMAWGAPFTPLL